MTAYLTELIVGLLFIAALFVWVVQIVGRGGCDVLCNLWRSFDLVCMAGQCQKGEA